MESTAAWKIIDQVLEHTWGISDGLDSDTVLSICRMFTKAGGSWKDAMDGDIDQMSMLETCIGNVIGSPKIAGIAAKVAFGK